MAITISIHGEQDVNYYHPGNAAGFLVLLLLKNTGFKHSFII